MGIVIGEGGECGRDGLVGGLRSLKVEGDFSVFRVGPVDELFEAFGEELVRLQHFIRLSEIMNIAIKHSYPITALPCIFQQHVSSRQADELCFQVTFIRQ
jgi:hypothetical protein